MNTTTDSTSRLDLLPGDRIRILPGAMSSLFVPLTKGFDMEVSFVGPRMGDRTAVEGTPLTTKGDYRTRDGLLAHRAVELAADEYTVISQVSRRAVTEQVSGIKSDWMRCVRSCGNRPDRYGFNPSDPQGQELWALDPAWDEVTLVCRWCGRIINGRTGEVTGRRSEVSKVQLLREAARIVPERPNPGIGFNIVSALRSAALEMVAPDAAWDQADAAVHLLGDYLADVRGLHLEPSLNEAVYRYSLFAESGDLVDDLCGAAEREDQRIGDENLRRR